MIAGTFETNNAAVIFNRFSNGYLITVEEQGEIITAWLETALFLAVLTAI